MITHLVDTDVLVDYLGQRRGAVELLQPLIKEERLATSVITYAEIFDGVLGSRNPDERLSALHDLIGGLALIGLEQEIAEAFARIRFELRSRGQPIPDHDAWIAATAITRDLPCSPETTTSTGSWA